jgi:hypothetical protein
MRPIMMTMPSKDWLPSGNEALRAFANSYSASVSAATGHFGLSQDDSDRLADLAAEYDAMLSLCNSPPTRTNLNFFRKDEAKASLAAWIRATARQIQASMETTDAQRQSLGLPVPKRHRTPAARITAAPELRVVSVLGRHVRIRVRDAERLGRGRPSNAQGAILYSFVDYGGTSLPPAARSEWTCEGTLTIRDSAIVAFPESVPRAMRVYLTAAWFNTRGTGPGCTPVPTILNLDGAFQAA